MNLGENMGNYGFKVAVDADPDALLFKGTVYSEVRADVCADCGFIRFYAANAQNLWRTYQNGRKDVS